MKNISRRNALKLAASGALALGAPAIIGRAGPASAQTAFAGEDLLVVSWSGNYESAFRETVIEPFNDQYGTKVETIGGWDQMIAQIAAAPADNPPFDITIGEEYVASAGIAQDLFLKKEWSTYSNMGAVQPWFFEHRPERSKDFGVPFGGGTSLLLLRRSLGIEPTSWNTLWDERLDGMVTCDSGYWWWTLSIPEILASSEAGLTDMYDIATAEPLFAKLDQLRVSRWFKDGAEQANVLNQGEADAATSYSSDAFLLLKDNPDEYLIAAPQEGIATWTDWYFKVRGTQHDDLADLFLDYILSKETQDRFLTQSLTFVSRRDVEVPDHWQGYPRTEADFEKFRLLTMDGWDMLNANYQAYDDRLKQTIATTTSG